VKIAILSDIHGNRIALESVLNEIEKNKINYIIILGDHITDFPNETKKIIKIIQSSSNFNIKGNREINLINDIENRKNYIQYQPTCLTYNELSQNEIDYIKSLLEQISIKFDKNFNIRCVHGSPFSISEQICENNINRNIEILEKIQENILLCGHTHKQWYKTFNEKIILNPGSVGINFDGSKTAQYGVIELNQNKIKIELKNTFYDFNLLKKTCDLTVHWTRLCISGMEDGKDYPNEFIQEAKNRYNQWPISNDSWNELFEEWCKNGIIE